MKKYRLIYNLLIYSSVGFLIYYLYRFDYFSFQNVQFDVGKLVLSILLLCSGFLISPFAWKSLLHKSGININYKTALTSEGLSIFTKYIPGKVMIILGRAAYVSLKSFPLKNTSLVSLKAQFISFWIGLSLGVIPLFFIPNSFNLILLSLMASSLIILFLHNKRIHLFTSRIISRIRKKVIEIPLLSFHESATGILYYIFMWCAWGLGFYFLSSSIYPTFFPNFLAFPLAATAGMLAIIIPGGLGVREGILAFVLYQSGIPIEIAGSISILARLWYIVGEVFVFSVAMVLKQLNR